MTPRAEWRPKVVELAARERCDGRELRFEPRSAPPRADTLIWFDYPTLLCLWRALKRVAGSYGKVRPDLAPGCPERIDIDFLRYIWSFNRVQRPRILRQLAEHGMHLQPIVIRRDADARAFLATVPATVH